MNKLIECVPNFSEGRDTDKIEKIVNPFRSKDKIRLLDYQRNEDHNRLVVTIVGESPELKSAIIESVGIAIDLIDLRIHEGQHPRMGAADVIPFIPVRNIGMSEVIEFSKEVAAAISETYHLPVFLYEKSASRPERQNLANIRRGEFENMGEKIRQPDWKPDFGTNEIHPTAGVTAVGARMPLVAFNVNLGTTDIRIADNIAKKIRHVGGGLRYCKAIAIDLKDRVQVSMNMTDYGKTPLYMAFELIRAEARRYGVNIVGSEIVGLVPAGALLDCAAYYLGLENFPEKQVLELAIY